LPSRTGSAACTLQATNTNHSAMWTLTRSRDARGARGVADVLSTALVFLGARRPSARLRSTP
jgi:hypothetical protein